MRTGVNADLAVFQLYVQERANDCSSLLIGTSVGPVIAGIFMQMYQTTIQGIVGSFAASQSYNLIFITAILMSMVFIVLFTIITKMTAKSRGRSVTNTF
jgi:hypothetical protein